MPADKRQHSWILKALNMKRLLTSMYVPRVMFWYQPSLACSIPMWSVRELLPVGFKHLVQPILEGLLLLPWISSLLMWLRRITWLIHVFASQHAKKPEESAGQMHWIPSKKALLYHYLNQNFQVSRMDRSIMLFIWDLGSKYPDFFFSC